MSDDSERSMVIFVGIWDSWLALFECLYIYVLKCCLMKIDSIWFEFGLCCRPFIRMLTDRYWFIGFNQILRFGCVYLTLIWDSFFCCCFGYFFFVSDYCLFYQIDNQISNIDTHKLVRISNMCTHTYHTLHCMLCDRWRKCFICSWLGIVYGFCYLVFCFWTNKKCFVCVCDKRPVSKRMIN